MTTPPDRYGSAVFGIAHYARTHSGGMKMNQLLRVLLDFVGLPDSALDEFAGGTVTGMTGNAAFPQPPVALSVVQTQQQAFSAAVIAAANGGTSLTAAKNKARAVLVDSLRQNALYVQNSSNNDLATLLTSGYQAASTNHSQSPLAQPVIGDLVNGNTGELVARVKSVTNARTYEARYAVVGAGSTPGPWQSGGLFTSSKSIIITGLTPGTTYAVEVRAIGGSTGYSEWSNAVSHMSL